MPQLKERNVERHGTPPARQKAKENLKHECRVVLTALIHHQHGWVFNYPIDPVELGLPDYFDIVKKPMDLGTISNKLDLGQYHSFDQFSADVRLTFWNAMLYNLEGSVVHNMAKELEAVFLAKKRIRDIRLMTTIFFGIVRLNILFRQARIRANERLYTPGGRGYLSCKRRFEKEANRFKNEREENLKVDKVNQETATKRHKNLDCSGPAH